MKISGTNKLKRFFTEYYKILILCCCLALLNIFFLAWSFGQNDLTFGNTFIFLLISTILLEIILCVIIFISKSKKWQIEKIFLVTGLIVGLLYVFALPVGRAPDEVSHFTRVYELSKGHLISDVNETGRPGTMEASNITIVQDYRENNVTYYDILEDMSIYPDENNLNYIQTSAYSYNIVSYFPHTVGMFIGNTLHLPLLVTIYISKLFNMVTCILVLYFSIKYIPFLKKMIFLLAFLPITMQAMASLSPDGLVTASSVALIAFVLNSIYSFKGQFSKKHYCLAFIICLFLSMGKIVYAPLCLLLFSIPKERFGSTKKKYLTIIMMGAIIFSMLLAWLIVAPSLQSSYDPEIQISNILANPIRYLATVLQSMSVNAHLYITGFFGGFLEWFDVLLSPIYIISTFIIFVVLCIKAKQTYTIPSNLKILSISIFSLITFATFTTMYIQWTKTGETIIDGVQGRYFLPLLLLIPLSFIPVARKFKPAVKKISDTSSTYYLYCYLIFESVYAVTTIVCSHL